MKKSILLLCALTLLIVTAATMTVRADLSEGSLASGYYITTNWHGIDVPTGAEVIATAKTTDWRVDKVQFIWLDPSGYANWTDTVSVHPDGTYNGHTVYSAVATHVPEEVGDWTVKANFLDLNGYSLCCCDHTVARKATSFFVVPEIPVIGTAGAAVAMFAGLAVKMRRKPQN